MPFRAGNATRELALFGEFARRRQKTHKDKKKRGGISISEDVGHHVPVYVPGFVLFTMPGQPWWLFDIDVAFWGNFLYVVGSVIYVAQALYYWHDLGIATYDDYNANNPSNYLNLLGSALFVANALVCQLDWWLTKNQSSIMNLNVEHLEDEHSTEKGTLHVEDISKRILNLYFWSNNFFFCAAMVFLIWGIWQYDMTIDHLGCRASFCWSFAMPFTACTFYVLSALCALCEYYETKLFREKSALPPLTLFNWDFMEVDWFGWGDLLYIIAAVLPWCQSFLTGFGSPDQMANSVVAPLYFTSNLVFLVDSLAYQIGYQLFVHDIIKTMKKRHDEELAEHRRVGSLHHLHDQDTDSESDAEDPSPSKGKRRSYVASAVTKMMLRREQTLPDQRRRSSGHGGSIMAMHRSSLGQGQGQGQGQYDLAYGPGGSPRRFSGGGPGAVVMSPLQSQRRSGSFGGAGSGFELPPTSHPPPPGMGYR